VKRGKVNSKGKRVKIGSDEKKEGNTKFIKKNLSDNHISNNSVCWAMMIYVENTRKILLGRKT